MQVAAIGHELEQLKRIEKNNGQCEMKVERCMKEREG